MTTRNLSFFGGAASTTGSMILLEAAGARILLDAGLFEGNLAETAQERQVTGGHRVPKIRSPASPSPGRM